MKFNLEDYEIKFKKVSDEILTDIAKYIQKSLLDSEKIEDPKHKLFQNDAKKCNSLDELLSIVKQIIVTYYAETSIESDEKNWDFIYYIDK